jgi:hypothetical protein
MKPVVGRLIGLTGPLWDVLHANVFPLSAVGSFYGTPNSD